MRRLARRLSEWTTVGHRKNAETTRCFSCGRHSAATAGGESEADRFIGAVRDRMERPSPFRDHPYWRGAIAAFKEATGLRLTRAELRYALGLEHPVLSRKWLATSFSRALDFLLLGSGPKLRPWHPRSPDHGLVLQNLAPVMRQKDKKLVIIGNSPSIFSTVIPDGGERYFRIQTKVFLRHPPGVLQHRIRSF